jgi:hypothetical protein
MSTMAAETTRYGMNGSHRIARHLDAFDGQLLSLEVHRADCAIRDEYHCQSVLINITLQGGRTRALTGAD